MQEPETCDLASKSFLIELTYAHATLVQKPKPDEAPSLIQYRCDLQPFLLDTLDFIIEQIELARDSATALDVERTTILILPDSR